MRDMSLCRLIPFIPFAPLQLSLEQQDEKTP
jgi:hypothetical protein